MPRTLCLLLIFCLAAACSDSVAPAGTTAVSQMVGASGGAVTSRDGRLTLEIPAGALGNDTEITIRPLAPSERDPAFAGLDVRGAYELGPDGQQFAQPITVTFVLNESPALPSGTIESGLVVLLTSSGSGVEVAEPIAQTVDADANRTVVTGRISHFSAVHAVAPGVRASVSGVPAELLLTDEFDAKLTVTSTASSLISGPVAGMTSVGGQTGFNGTDTKNVGSLQSLTAQTLETTFTRYGCPFVGDGTVTVLTTFVTPEFTINLRSQTVFNVTLEITKELTHKHPPFEREQIPIGSAPEGLARRGPRIIATGDGGIIILRAQDLLPLDTIPAGPTNRVTEIEDTLNEINSILGAGPGGLSITPVEDTGFGAPQTHLPGNNITDVYPKGGNAESGEASIVDFTDNKVYCVRPNAGGDAFELGPVLLDGATLPSPSGNLISAYWFADGDLVALTDGSPGQLWYKPAAGGAQLVSNDEGIAPRTVRFLDGHGVTASFGDALNFGFLFFWERTAPGTFVDDGGIAVGGPVGIDLCPTPGGDVAVASTAFRSNEYQITLLGDGGGHEALPVPAGCEGPGHAIWLDDDATAIGFTCNTSGHLVVEPVDLSSFR